MPFLTLNPDDSAPLYRQIARALKQAIAEGRLQPGDKLPTVRELSQELSAAGGTVKRAYEELCRQGLLEMAQGKGTFVAQPSSLNSRKEQAMEAIDELLDRLEDLAFSSQEIQIFLDLKLRERLRDAGLRIAVIDCCPEGLQALTDRLYGLTDGALYPLLLEEALADPGRLVEEMDLAVTTDRHAGQLAPVLKGRVPLADLCMRPADTSILTLARLPSGFRLGILGQSQAFFRLARELCRRLCPDVILQGVSLPEPEALSRLLQSCDGLLTPSAFEQFCPPAVLEQAATRPLVRLELEPDQGSLRTLEDLLRQTIHKRR